MRDNYVVRQQECPRERQYNFERQRFEAAGYLRERAVAELGAAFLYTTSVTQREFPLCYRNGVTVEPVDRQANLDTRRAPPQEVPFFSVCRQIFITLLRKLPIQILGWQPVDQTRLGQVDPFECH